MSDRPPLLARRQFLAGATGLLTIPLLPSALPRRAWAAATKASTSSKKRLILVHLSAGVIKESWVPSQTGSNFPLSDSLSGLAAVQKSLLLLSNMKHDAAYNSPARDGQGLHARGLATLFTGANLQLDLGRPRAAISMDQIYAQAIAGQTPVSSLHLTLNDEGDGDANYANQASTCISWVDANTPVADESNPAKIFAKYFAPAANNVNSAQQVSLRAMRKSVLDGVLDHANSLKARLDAADAQKLDQYFTSVRSLEQQLTSTTAAACSQTTAPSQDLSADRNKLIQERANAMMDLMTLAISCDLTRSLTFSFGPGHSSLFYNFLQKFDYSRHESTHHGDQQDDVAKMVKWEMTTLGRFWQGLQAVPEASGTLLDNSVSLVSSEVARGQYHNYVDHGVLIAGGCGGAITTGRHVRAGTDKDYGSLTEVELAILQGLGTGVTSFGDFKVTKAMDLKTV